MENKTIRIALSSILIYLIFKKSYDVLSELFLWLILELRIENEYIWIPLHIIIGILSLLLLLFLYNRFLRNEIPKTKEVYILLMLTVILSILTFGIIKLSVSYLVEIDLDKFRSIHFSQSIWSKQLKMVFSILGLIYFLWKLKTDKNTVTNNSSKKMLNKND